MAARKITAKRDRSRVKRENCDCKAETKISIARAIYEVCAEEIGTTRNELPMKKCMLETADVFPSRASKTRRIRVANRYALSTPFRAFQRNVGGFLIYQPYSNARKQTDGRTEMARVRKART